MTPESRAKHLERVALRAAQKAQRRHPDFPVTREELLGLKVPSLVSWQRLLFIGGGLAGIAFGLVFALGEKSHAGGIALIVIGGVLVLFGILGRRRSVEALLNGLGDGLGEVVINTIFEALN